MRQPGPFAPPSEAAKAASLRYVNDAGPGIRRRRSGKGFAYFLSDGTPLRDKTALARIRALAIPPAWEQVWICPLAEGHLQATGRDARGRKQYRYHARWRRVRDETKYERMLPFGQALPRIRARLRKDLSLPGLPREKVLATIVRLLETSFIRVGNEEYARSNRSFGLTTLRNRHVEISGSTLRFRFQGKSGKSHTVDVDDRRIAGLVRRCRELPGQDLFQYLDESGEPQPIDSGAVNDYLRAISGQDFTAKDFRTWNATLRAMQIMRSMPLPDAASERVLTRCIVGAVKRVAAELRNTPAVCRKSYINPVVFDTWRCGALHERISEEIVRAPRKAEALVAEFLRRHANGASRRRGRESRQRPPAIRFAVSPSLRRESRAESIRAVS